MASKQRVITATIGWAFAFALITLAPAIFYNATVCVIALLGFNECLRMSSIHEEVILYSVGLIAFSLFCITLLILPLRNLGLGLIATPLIVLTTALISIKDPKRGIEQVAKVFFAGVYASLLFYLVILRVLPDGRELIFVVSAGTWGRDLASFVFGQLTRNGRVILPTISPRKTYGGAICGLIAAILVVGLSARSLLPNWSWTDWLTVGILIGILGQIGDLAESWIKRGAHASDSSRILPGQGGILDSFDSFMFTAPAVYVYVSLILSQ